MFGLDARIALAIFALLGVVTTATIYKAIQQVKVTAIINHLNEVNNAAEAFMLDTGTNIPVWNFRPQIVQTGDLITSTIPGWNGPYLSWGTPEDDEIFPVVLKSPVTKGNVTMRFWDISGIGIFCGSDPCYYWARVNDGGEISLSIKEAIDERIDGGDGSTAGLFRYEAVPNSLMQLRGPQALR